MNVANGYWLPFLKARHIPTVVNVDGIEWQRDKWGRYARNVFRGGAKVTARFADTLIYDSRVIAQVWEREFKRSGEFIPYGGDQIGGIPPPDGLSSRQYVLFVARLVPENSAREFFAAASDLCQNFDIVVVGSSGYKNEFDHLAAQLAEEHERVRWYGHINDDRVLNALWYNAGVYFHGHTAGGTNPSLVQAMACGAPILAVDTRFNREVLGDHGTFVQPEPHSIVASISRLMRNCKWQEETAEYAKERAASGYSWNTVCSDYERVLHTTAETQS
jgi:glycosyltransferase involved in cell wall biosynthesis